MSQMELVISQTDPKAIYLAHKGEIDRAIARVLHSGWYILGQEVAKFEEEFAAYLGTNYAIGVANGTDALELALRACDVRPGDTVFTVAHTAVATVAAIESVGATPVLVDIDPTYYTMDPDHLEDTIKAQLGNISTKGNHPKAIIPVHLYGQPADMPAIVSIAKRYGLYVIEDCAQSVGSTLLDRKTGTWGDVATFSFYPTKNLGAFGDGGMVVTDTPELADKVQILRQYGWRNRYISEVPGRNSRLDEIQATILRVNLRYLDQENIRRRKLAEKYNNQLIDTGLDLPGCRPQAEHSYHQYVVRTSQRDNLIAYLRERNIGTGVHYPVPIHLQPAYRHRLGEKGTLPHTERAACKILSLPMFPYLKQECVKLVARAIKNWAIEST